LSIQISISVKQGWLPFSTTIFNCKGFPKN